MDPERHADRAELRRLVAELYASVSGPPGQPPTFQPDSDLLLPTVRMCRTVRTPDGAARHEVMDAEQYARSVRALVTPIGFYEVETRHEAFVYGDIAHVLSHYQAYSDKAHEQRTKAGVNSIQLLRVDGRWRVFNMIWDDELNLVSMPEGE